MSPWIAQRAANIDSSGIRKIFELVATMKRPINLSIGQPDFDAPQPLKQAAIEAINDGHNGYSVTQGMSQLQTRLQSLVENEFGHADRKLLVTSGISGGLTLAMLALVDPGDEVIVFDPYFVSYEALVRIMGGSPVFVDTYPDFRIDVQRVAAAITPRTKMILLNSPSNPTGALATAEEVQQLADLAEKHQIVLLSDEIYREFCYDEPLTSPARFNPQTLVVDGFSKSHGVTGWRLGFAHGPSDIIDKMTMMQQYTFVCAPHPLQWAALAALDTDMSAEVDMFRQRRQIVVDGLRAAGYQVAQPGGAFYVFPRAPWGTASEFVDRALQRELLIIPGKIFSQHDTHFRISYAADVDTIEQGLDVLRDLVAGP